MFEKNKLNLGITLLFLLGLLWLISVESVDIFHVSPLLMFAVIVVKWISGDKDKPSRLLGFFVKTFTLFLIATGVAYFVVWLGITAPNTYSAYPVSAIVETGIVFIFPISLLLEATSIIIYGIHKIKLRVWEVFLSSWYVSMFVFISYFYFVWRPYQQTSYSEYTGPIHAGAMSDITLGFFIFQLPLLPAVIYTIIYAKYKKPQIQKPT